jgi:hydrogenase nickel incorporation protein HypB
MTKRALQDFDIEGVDLLILENIGNLVCPAEFDTGAHKNVMLLSVPEGDDKPLKYPLMFTVSDIVLITKTDTMGFFNFDLDKAKERILKLNPNAVILPVSAKTGEGMEELESLILDAVQKNR